MIVIEVLDLLCIILLSLYGLNSLVLVWLCLRHRDDPLPSPPAPTIWPRVTVQLPVYSELHVVERLISAAARLDYPRDRLAIQVLDGSTEETNLVAERAIAGSRSRESMPSTSREPTGPTTRPGLWQRA